MKTPIERIQEATYENWSGEVVTNPDIAMEIAIELETALDEINELKNEIALLKK
jgi:hypothetical protein